MIRGRIHTDLALEAKERYEEDNVEIRGVCIEEEYNEEKDIRTTLVKIETENGARAMGRPQGSYLTLEAPNLSIPDEGYHREISEELARQVKKLIPEKKELTVLVVGLGNRQDLVWSHLSHLLQFQVSPFQSAPSPPERSR